MSEAHHIFADIDDKGMPRWRQLDRVKKIFYSLRGKAIELSIVEVFGRKTLPQIRYYRGVVLPYTHTAILALGNKEWTKDDVHEEMLRRFAPKKEMVDGRTGEIVSSVPVRTRDMSKPQMTQYIDDICDWGAEFLNINIPPPTQEERNSWR